MQFNRYLNERSELIYDLDVFNETLHKECKPYLKMIKHYSKPFYRGMNEKVMGIKPVRKNRTSLGTRDDVFEKLNPWLQKNKHNRRDQSFMVTTSEDAVGQFGNPYFVFPMGKFSYTWMNARDFNMKDNRTGWSNDTANYYDYENDEWKDDDWAERTKRKLKYNFKDYFHTDKGIDDAINAEYEIWINCKKYMFVMSSRQYGWHKKDQLVIEYND